MGSKISFVNEEGVIFTYTRIEKEAAKKQGYFGDKLKQSFPLYLKNITITMDGDVYGS